MTDRDESGRFASTALTRKRDTAIANLEGGDDALYGMVAAGMSLRAISNELGLDGADSNTRAAVYQYLRRDMARYDEARRLSAESHAEMAGEVYGDTAPETTADAKWRNDKSAWHRWMAETRDPSLRGKAGVEVNVDIGQLHLDALRAGGRLELNPDLVSREDVRRPSAARVLQAEIEEGDDDE